MSGPDRGVAAGVIHESKKEMANATAHSTLPARLEGRTNGPIKVIRQRIETSLVSYPKRNNLWGDPQFKGNCDGTLFRDLVLHYQPNSIADPMMGSGTTQDVTADLNRETGQLRAYWGADLSTGFNLQTMNLPGGHDFIWVHPPYWNVIRYSDGAEGDLSCIDDFEAFCETLIRCLERCAVALIPGGRLAVLVGDVRRQGRYYTILRRLLNAEASLGQLRSIIIKAQHNTASRRKRYRMDDPPIHHEYCVVIQRPEETASTRGR